MLRFLLMSLVVGTLPLISHGQGFEKSGIFGGRSGALAGVGVTLNGPDALSHNPAGLIGRPGNHLASHLSPIAGQARTPINNQNHVETSTLSVTPSGALMYSHAFNNQWAFGFGSYGVGGSGMKFENVKFTEMVGDPVTTSTDLVIAEAALGVAYRPIPKLSLGLALRYTMYSASMTTASRAFGGLAIGVPEFEELQGADTSGYKFGMQYSFNRDHKFGLSYRSESSANLKGKMTGGKILTPLVTADLAPGDASLKMTLPQSLTMGMTHNLSPRWLMHWEYAWIQYSKLSSLTLTSSNSLVGTQEQELNWKDSNVIRMGWEYRATWPMRFGVNYATPTTDSQIAGPGLPPAPLYGASIGTGYIAKTWSLDVALDYATASGTGGTAPVGSIGSDSRAGNYSFWAAGLHTSVRWEF